MKKLLLILFLISTTAVAQNTRFNIRSDVKIGDSAVGMSSWAAKYASPYWVYTNFLAKSDTGTIVATKYDLTQLVTTETDPIFALDSNAILHWYDSILKIATKYDIDTLTFLRSFTEVDPIFALDSANILHWYDTVAKIATYYDIRNRSNWDDSYTMWDYTNWYGWVDNTQLSLSFNATDSSLTVTKTGAHAYYLFDGKIYEVQSSPQVIPITGTLGGKGSYYFYVNDTSGTVEVMTSAWTLKDSKVPVAIVEWDKNNASPIGKYILYNELHECVFPRSLHYYLHTTVGTRYQLGGQISGETVLGADLSANNQFKIAEAEIDDEDRSTILPVKGKPVTATHPWTLYQRTAASTWKWDTLAVPYPYSATYITYENPTTGADVTAANNRYVNSYLLFTTAIDSARFIIVPGRAEYTSATLAFQEDPRTFNWSGLNIPEAVIMYRLTWVTSSAFTGALGRVKLNNTPMIINQGIATASSAALAESDPVFAGDSANLLHWADTTTHIATAYDLSQLVTVESDPVWLSDSSDYYKKTTADNKFQTLANLVNVTGTSTTLYATQNLVKAYGDSIKTTIPSHAAKQDSVNNPFLFSGGNIVPRNGVTTIPYSSTLTKAVMIDTVTGKLYRKTMGAGGSTSTDSIPLVASSTRGWIYPRTATDSLAIGKTVPTVALDVNGSIHDNGYKVLNHQEVNNTIANGKALNFDGTNDYVSLGTSTQLDLGTGDGTYFVRFKNDGNDGAINHLFYCFDATTWDWQNINISDAGNITGQIWDNYLVNGAKTIVGATDIGVDNKIHSAAFSIQRESATGLNLYVDGKLDATPVSTVGYSGSIASSGTKVIGYDAFNNNAYFKGSIYNFRYFNCALTAAEIKALSEGGSTPYYYTGASNTALTSGTLVIGKKYLIKTYVSNDDFTNVGASSNAAGVSFIATGTTPTHWAHSSNLLSQGEILSLDPAGISTATWFDQSGNGIDGTVSGAVVSGTPEHVNLNNANFTGNVGIGTTAPGSSLHVLGASSSPFRVARGTNVVGFELASTSSGGFGVYDYAADAYIWDAVGGSIYALPTYSVTVGATNRDLYIDNTGRIGYVSSTNKAKDSIRNIEKINWLYKLRPVNFVYRSDKQDSLARTDTTGFTIGQPTTTIIKADTTWRDSTYTTGTATGTTTITVKVIEKITPEHTTIKPGDTTWQTGIIKVANPYWKKNKQYGLVAEEVDSINREICSYDYKLNKDNTVDKEIATVNYSRLVVPLLKAVQDHQAEIDILNRLIEVKTITPDTNGIKKLQLASKMYISLTAPVVMPNKSQIANGYDGQEITLVGMHNTNALTLHNQDNIRISTATIQLKKFQTLTLIWAAPLNVWVEKGRSLNL